MKGKIAARIVTIVVSTAILAAALYIMANRLGLAEGMDFGAGAYYYADIPADDYAKINPDGTYTAKLPGWIYFALFFVWGWLMYKLWNHVDNK